MILMRLQYALLLADGHCFMVVISDDSKIQCHPVDLAAAGQFSIRDCLGARSLQTIHAIEKIYFIHCLFIWAWLQDPF